MANVSIGLDVGGTKIGAVLMDEEHHVLQATRIPTQPERGRERVINNILRSIHHHAQFAASKNHTLAGIGIGMPGKVPQKGPLGFNPNIAPLAGFDLRKRLKALPHLFLENDARCFALAEYSLGPGKGLQSFAGVIWGTGVGAGLILNGKLYKGPTGMGGEFGHTILDRSYPLKDGSGLQGSMESLTSGPHILQRYKLLKGKRVFDDPSELFKSKDPVAKRTWILVIDDFARGLAGLANTLDLQMIALGGGITTLPILDQLQQRFDAYLLPNQQKTRLIKARIGQGAGVIGAALLPFQR